MEEEKVINEENIEKTGITIVRIFKAVTCIPFILIGIIFIIVSTIAMISENKEVKNYVQTTAYLYQVIPDETPGETNDFYKSIYIYEVNGQTYEVSPKRLSGIDDFKEEEIVKYSKDDPSKSVISAHWENLLISGIGLIAFSIFVIFVGTTRIKISKKVN